MRDRKPAVIVTGSEGAIGSALCHALEGRFRVVGVDRDYKDSSHESVIVDLTSDESVRLGLAEIKEQHGNHIASVLHLAAYFDLSGEPNPLYDAVNCGGYAAVARRLARLPRRAIRVRQHYVGPRADPSGTADRRGCAAGSQLALPAIETENRGSDPRAASAP